MTRRLQVVGTGLGVGIVLGVTTTACQAAGSQAPWSRYVLAPSTVNVRASRIAQVSGDVSDPHALITGRGQTTMVMRPGGAEPSVILDYGRDVSGVPSIRLSSIAGGPTLVSSYSEARPYAAVTGDGGFCLDGACDQTRDDVFTPRGSGVVTTGLIQGGERYQRLTLTSPGAVRVAAVWIHFTADRVPAAGYRGWFLSSSPQLNRIWFDGAYTVQLDELPAGSLPRHSDPLDLILDGAKRDRAVWSADLGVEDPTVLDTTDDEVYVRDSLRLLGSWQNASGMSGTDLAPATPLGSFPESAPAYSVAYSMDEVDDIASFYRDSGDLGFVRAEWPMISRELSYNASLVGPQGLLVTTSDDGLDWDVYDGPKTGAVTAYNVIYYETLRDAAMLSRALGMARRAETYDVLAARLRVLINRYLFDRGSGLYSVSEAHVGTYAQDANSLAVLDGVAPSGRSRAILAGLQARLPATRYGPLPFTDEANYQRDISPFVCGEELDALFANRDTTGAFALMRRVWGHMSSPGPYETGADWEVVAPGGAPAHGGFTSLAHGWSSGATAAESQYVLGVQSTTPGFRTFDIAPQPGDLSWAQGRVPSPEGPFDVAWRYRAGRSRFSMQITVPHGTSGSVILPVGGSAVVTVRARDGGHWKLSIARMIARAGTISLPVRDGGTYVINSSRRARASHVRSLS